MWKDYSKSYIKNNRAAAITVMAAALAASLFLSLLCGIAFNFWIYDVEQIQLDEGDWQGRIVCEKKQISHLSLAELFANVEKAVINEELSGEDEIVLDVYFYHFKSVYDDMPLIAERLGVEKDAVSYNSLLLSRYFVHDPEDESPPMLLTVYLVILLMVAVSLILIIRNSFELSMNNRIRQFGIFSGIGATPAQIRICLLQEAMVLSILPVLTGSVCGIALSYGVILAVNHFAAGVPGRHEAVFQYHPLLFAAVIFLSFLTVLLSAWLPAKKLGRMTPLEAVRYAGGPLLKKKKHSRILSAIFGIKGELAGNALKAQRKALRISSLSLVLSYLGFSVMLCVATLSDISTRFTYFERYQDVWDIMITVKDTGLPESGVTQKLRKTAGVEDLLAYQKAEAVTFVPEASQSSELASLGGLGAVAGARATDGRFQVSVPVIILDDTGFLNFCTRSGITPSLDGAIVYNRIWDRVNSNFRYKEYVPFVKEDHHTTVLYKNDLEVKVPVLSYTDALPALREEYENYALVHFVPLTMWENKIRQVCESGSDSYIRILSDNHTDPDRLAGLEKEIVQTVSRKYKAESENRIQERISNEHLIAGTKFILGAFCVLLAIIGIASVFSVTSGFLRQRKREFARYMSMGLTLREMRTIFCIEAFVIAGRPLLITLPLTVLTAQAAVTAACLEPAVFWREAPVAPVLVFAAAIVLFVTLAYYIGAKRLLRCNLNETLRNDALM